MNPLRLSYDYIIVDTNPSLGSLTITALTAADEVIIPIDPELFALTGLQALVDTIKKIKRKLNPSIEIGGILFTKCNKRTNLYRRTYGQVTKAVAEADKLIANKILDVIRTMLCKDREVQSFEYTEARKAYFTEQMICEILMALEQAAMSFDMEYDDRQKAISTELSKAARKEWYLRHKDKGVEP